MEHLTVEQLLDYADGRLASEEASRVEAHLATCSTCAAELSSLQDTIQQFSQDDWFLPPAATRAAVQESFRRHYSAQGAAAAPEPSLGDRLRALLTPLRQPALALAFALLLILAGLLYQLLQPPLLAEAATATSVSGTTQIQGETGEWASLSAGDAVESGNRLRTGDDGSLLLTFSDGSTTRLEANTELLVRDLQVNPRVVALRQESGETVNQVLSA
ncbi:MAG: zf-HC2 domain-containing protein, partial [Chloroflexota bacterium]